MRRSGQSAFVLRSGSGKSLSIILSRTVDCAVCLRCQFKLPLLCGVGRGLARSLALLIWRVAGPRHIMWRVGPQNPLARKQRRPLPSGVGGGWYQQQTCSLHFRHRHCGPFTAVQVVLGLSDLPAFSPYLSLSIVPTSPMMRLMHFIIVMPARRARVRH